MPKDSEGADTAEWFTMLLVAGKNLKADPLGSAFDPKRSTFDVVTQEQLRGSGRHFDSRLAGPCGRYWLTSAQQEKASRRATRFLDAVS